MAGVAGRPGLEGQAWKTMGVVLCVGRKETGQKSHQEVQMFGCMAKLLITNQCCQYRPQTRDCHCFELVCCVS